MNFLMRLKPHFESRCLGCLRCLGSDGNMGSKSFWDSVWSALLVVLCLFLVASPPTANAQVQTPTQPQTPIPSLSYPVKPVKIIVGYGPGGTGDITVRLVAQKLTELMGQPFVIENHPSAGGIVASQMVQQSVPDGHTLNFIAAGNFAMTPSLFKSLPFDPVKDFEMISMFGTFGFALAVDGNSSYKTVKDFLDDAKNRSGRVFVGTISPGSAQFLAAEVFKSMTKSDLTLVTYKNSADVMRALKASDVNAIFETLAPLLPQAKTNSMRLLGVTDEQRFAGLADVPTLAQAGVSQYAVSGWNGLAAPKKTPKEVINKLNAAINAVVTQPDIRQKFLELGVTAKGNTPEQMLALLQRDIQWWREVIAQSNIEKQ